MVFTISQLLSSVTPKLGGATSSDIASFNDTVYTAAWRMASKIDIRGTKRLATLSSPIYDAVTKYALPADFNTPIDLLPQVGREGAPGTADFVPRFSREFSLRGELNSMGIEWFDDVPVLDARRAPVGNVVTLAEFNEATASTPWVGTGDASNLYQETLNYVAGSSSLGFDLSGATGSGVLTATALTSQDFTTWRVRDSVFLWVYMPTVMTAVALKRGSSSANYYSKSVTVQQDGTAFRVGWNLLRFDLSTATQTGTANLAATVYSQITFTYPAGTAITGMAVDSMTDQLGDYYQIGYYSKYLFRDTTGIWLEQPVDGTTIINTDPDAFTILTFEVLSDLVTELEKKGGRGSAAQEAYNHYDKILGAVGVGGLYDAYARRFPSERIAAQQTIHSWDL
jgi:hypothetical protein